jgi:phage gp29-like protein
MKNESIILSQKIASAIDRLPNPSQVLKSKSATMELFQKVARHPDVFPQIDSYKAALCGLQVIAKTESKSIADLFNDFFDNFDLRDMIRSAAAGRDFGFAVMEVTEWAEYKGLTVPCRIDLCPPEFFFFDRDRRLRLSSDKMREGIDVDKEYPNRFILCQNEATLINPYGIGLLDVAYWVAVGLNGNFEFLMQFVEDDGRDKWIGKYQQGATQEEINSLLNMMVQVRNNGVAAIPQGMEVEPKPMTGRSSTNDLYRNTDEMLRRKIEKLWTGTDLTMQVAGKGGYSSSESGLTIREYALEGGKTLALSAIRQIAGIVCRLNNLPELPSFIVQLPEV